MVEENILKQKSRIQWLKLGDLNSAFFHASIKNRNAQKKITRLLTQIWTYTQNQEEVQQEIIQFYKQLLGSTVEEIPAIEPDVMKRRNVMTRNQQLKLIAHVSKEQVY